jgi:hypothetical protein
MTPWNTGDSFFFKGQRSHSLSAPGKKLIESMVKFICSKFGLGEDLSQCRQCRRNNFLKGQSVGR